jgi:uncharacterized protein with HEPN domain
MRGFRNYVVHGYFDLLWDKVALAVASLPELIESIEAALRDLTDGE